MITVFKEPGSGSVPEGHLRNPFESRSETLIGSSNYEYNTYRTVHTVELGSNLGSQDQLLDTGARYEEVTSWRQIILQALEHGSLPTSSAQRLGTDLANYRYCESSSRIYTSSQCCGSGSAWIRNCRTAYSMK